MPETVPDDHRGGHEDVGPPPDQSATVHGAGVSRVGMTATTVGMTATTWTLIGAQQQGYSGAAGGGNQVAQACPTALSRASPKLLLRRALRADVPERNRQGPDQGGGGGRCPAGVSVARAAAGGAGGGAGCRVVHLFTQDLSGFGSTQQPLPTNSGLRAEIGGMRFQNYHIYVGYLAQKLGLPFTNFPADISQNWQYLRGTALQTLGYSKQTRYALAPQEQSELGTPGTIVGDALIPAIVQPSWLPTTDGTVTLRDLVNKVMAASYGGTPLWQQGFWNLVVSNGQYGPATTTANISNEAYELFVDSGAYDTIPANWNAATAVVDMVADFAGSPSYYALTAGYMTLPLALQNALRLANPEMIQTGKGVVSVRQISPGTGYTVGYADGTSITADNVILALPPRALQMMTLPPSVPAIANQLQQATPIPLFKIFLVYQTPGNTDPWWQSITTQSGTDCWPQYTRMCTDLPMRQIYNFGSYYDSASNVTYSLLQASYSDALKAGYWAGLLSEEDKQAINTSIYGGIAVSTGTATYTNGLMQWPAGSVQTMHPLFMTVHNQFVTLLQAVAAAQSHTSPSPSLPIAGAAMDWATDPFGGGVNFWDVGVDIQTAYPQLLIPVPMTEQSPTSPTGVNGLFIVGEGYSLLQGWVEGALWSVEDAMAPAYSGWSTPRWLSTVPVPQPSSDGFNDTGMALMSGSPITQMAVRSGDVLDAIQATNGSWQMPQHGGNSGAAAPPRCTGSRRLHCGGLRVYRSVVRMALCGSTHPKDPYR